MNTMNKMKSLTLFCSIGLLLFFCTPKKESKQEEINAEAEIAKEGAVITLTQAPDSPTFPDATLTKKELTIEKEDSLYSLNYSFDVQNYKLGVQTADAEIRGIANSGKGQHIHYIVNNGPYAAHYMSSIIDQLEEGNYVVLAFLSRSYHESVKSAGAYFIENITVGNAEADEADLAAPHLFYSRPKGTYSGADTKKVMLDFYLLNTTIAPDGNKVSVTINGNEFRVEEWKPHYIEGMPLGENTIKLELIDTLGNWIEGPFNSVERTITLTE